MSFIERAIEDAGGVTEAILLTISVVLFLFVGALLGFKLEFPQATMLVPPSILMLVWGFSIFTLAYFSAIAHIKKWLRGCTGDDDE